MLGTYVTARMKELGISVKTGAETTGLTEGAIYMIRRGERTKLEPDTWLQLAELLRVPVKGLMQQRAPTAAVAP